MIKFFENCHLHSRDRDGRIILKASIRKMVCKNGKVTELTQNAVQW
jgi:hypothetical protein